jgi:coenzyme F420-reducing hydrogenase gamma subunit
VVKLRVAFFGFGSCEGCRYRVVNELHKLTSVGGIEIMREPLLGLSPDAEYDVAVIEGAVGTRDFEEVRKIRERARLVVALGSCAMLGGVSSLGYRLGLRVEEYVKDGYTDALPIHQVIRVDSYVRGCPASVDELVRVLKNLAAGFPPSRYERRFKYERTTDILLDDGFLRLDAGKCIVCGRCVDVCAQLGVYALTQAFRSYSVTVTTPMQLPFLEAGCIRCGLCTAYCPVSALTYRSDVEEALKLAEHSGRVVAERLALEAAADVLGVKPGQVASLLRELGFSEIEVVDPLALASGAGGLIPLSAAEERWVRQRIPEASKLLRPHVRLPAAKDTVVITACLARKEDHAPTITVHELVEVAKGSRVVLEDLPDEPLRSAPVGGVEVAVGPGECRAAVESYVKNPSGTIVLQICPGGCARGSGMPYKLLCP